MLKKYIVLTALLLLAGVSAVKAQPKGCSVYGVGFYNLENLFDTCHDAGKNDYEYLPDGRNKWDAQKYRHKLRNMARVLSEMGTDVLGDAGCAAIGVAEVENDKCLTDLCNQEPLKARGFKFVHVEGPDQRGIDCALLYNPKLFRVRDVKLVPYVYKRPQDSLKATRGFLTVSGTLAGEHVAIVVCHLPSRAADSFFREEGGLQVKAVKDSLLRDDPQVKVLVMGDMNDDPHDRSMATCLQGRRRVADVGTDDMYNPWWDELATRTGTLLYDGAWNLFDQILLSPSLIDKQGTKNYSTLKLYGHEVFRRDYLFQQKGAYKGNTLRTIASGTWLDGYSDHLPTIVYLIKEQRNSKPKKR